MKRLDLLNHLAGKYIAFSFNDPKHYPRKAFLHDMKEEAEESQQVEDDNLTRLKFLAWAKTRSKTK